MRFVHTADWHLGRIFHGVHLTEDQAVVLEQLHDGIREAKADVLLVSGDVYDRPVPPADAVRLLDDFLSRVVLGLKVPVVLIAGNHDSPDRLAFGSALLSERGLHLFGTLSSMGRRLSFSDQNGRVELAALPYAEPPLVRQFLDDASLQDHNAAMKALLETVRRSIPAGARTVLLAHAFVAGSAESESERPLSVGGAGTVEVSLLEGFHYVALGHLHRPQSAGLRQVQYSGSLLKYSFSEASHAKSYNIVEMDGEGHVSVERVPLVPRRDVRCITGELAELLRGPAEGESREDYLMALLTDRAPLLDPMGKLLSVYPNLLHLERVPLKEVVDFDPQTHGHHNVTDVELFRAFFKEVTGEPLGMDEETAFEEIVEKLRRDEREASS